MKQNKVLAIGAALLIVAGGAWYWGSPAYAMSQLRDAAQSGDKDDLQERIDFPKVRDSLKTTLRARLAAEVTSSEQDNPFAKFGAMMAMGMIDGMVEGFVTPESMSAMIKQGKMQKPGQAEAAPVKPVEWTIERDGLDKFTAIPATDKGDAPPRLIFHRDGLGWDLVEIEIPEDAKPTA